MAEAQATLPRILETATQLFIEHGYHGLAMREIAAGVGVSKPALYYHFRDKESLFLAVLEHHLGQVVKLVREAAERPTVRAGLEDFLRAFFDLPVPTRQMIRLSSQEIVHLSREVRDTFGQRYAHDFVHGLRDMLAAGMVRGELRTHDAGLAVRMLLGLMLPFVASESEEGQLALSILDVYWNGVGT